MIENRRPHCADELANCLRPHVGDLEVIVSADCTSVSVAGVELSITPVGEYSVRSSGVVVDTFVSARCAIDHVATLVSSTSQASFALALAVAVELGVHILVVAPLSLLTRAQPRTDGRTLVAVVARRDGDSDLDRVGIERRTVASLWADARRHRCLFDVALVVSQSPEMGERERVACASLHVGGCLVRTSDAALGPGAADFRLYRQSETRGVITYKVNSALEPLGLLEQVLALNQAGRVSLAKYVISLGAKQLNTPAQQKDVLDIARVRLDPSGLPECSLALQLSADMKLAPNRLDFSVWLVDRSPPSEQSVLRQMLGLD